MICLICKDTNNTNNLIHSNKLIKCNCNYYVHENCWKLLSKSKLKCIKCDQLSLDLNLPNEEDIDTVIDIAEEHPLIKHSIQINRTRRSNLYLLCMLFIFLFIVLPFIVFFESTKNNENLNKLRIK
jgi:hypothetical protein